jgi:N-acetyl-anhydromuramyl-L-alanine amidase AmpD
MKIDKTTYTLGEDNYIQQEFTKRQIVIGSTGRKDMLHYGSWTYRHNGKYKKTSTFTIDKQGNIFQHYDPKYYSKFLGKVQDKASISISLVNEGWLDLDSMHGRYIDWLGNIYNKDEEVVTKKWRHHLYWVAYTKEQIESLKSLVTYLTEEYNVPKNVITHNAHYEDVDLFDGIVYRSNYLEEVSDVTPAFNIAELKKIENE